MTIYIASDEKYKGKIKEDLLIQNYFLSKNYICEILTIPEILSKVSENDTVMLKSIWGYHINHSAFLEQISRLENKSVKLINDYKYILWNIDKYSYISELSLHTNIKLIPTKMIDLSTCQNETEINIKIKEEVFSFTKNDSYEEFVIKPNISASGYLTYKYRILDNNRELVNSLLINKDKKFIIQPFRNLITNGETSVIVLNGEVCYGIQRFPGVLADKDDPVYIDKEKINNTILQQVNLLYNFFSKKFSSTPRICRVDFVEIENDFEIIEIEVIDPDLFFKFLPENQLRKSLESLCNI
jgi:hypothetical protein